VLLNEERRKMRFHAIASQAALIVALQLASSLAYVRESAAQQPISRSPKREEIDHVRLSTAVVKSWREISVESPVYTLDDGFDSTNRGPDRKVVYLDRAWVFGV
jgi:hypothetical protein